jgi:hypothetical protein
MFWKTWAELGNSTDIRPYELIPLHSSCFPFSKDFLCGRILHVFWGRTLMWIHCTYFGRYFEWTQNATPDVDSKLFVFLNGKLGMWDFFSRSQYSYRHGKEKRAYMYIFYSCVVLHLLQLRIMLLIFHGHIWMEDRIIHVQSWNYYAVRGRLFFPRFVNQSSTSAVCRVDSVACLGFDGQFIFVFQANYVCTLCINPSKRKSKFFFWLHN